jgi:glycosyltransferase involved in cell wall biosynthesis
MTHHDPVVSVVLGSYNRHAFLKATLESVRADGQDIPYEIIVVDGGSTDGSFQYLAKQKDVITIIQHNGGKLHGKNKERRSWGYFMNLGFKAAQGKYILMISDDCLLIPGALRNGVEQFEKMLAEGKKLGAIAYYWRNWPEQEKYWAGLTFGNRYFVNHGLYLRTALLEINFIDEQNYRFYYADSDLALRLAQAGYICADASRSYVEHYSHANQHLRRSNETAIQNDKDHFVTRWSHLGIPAYDWVEKEYDDPGGTALKYWRWLAMGSRLNMIWRRVLTPMWNLARKVKRAIMHKSQRY